ncbi:MAG: ATP-binding cassette domain-containing protein [Candidatus Nanoarchaeia archaeon]|nr:ATP-binding cassette domain-containing protein [Candidatus Nanoarchaeia archaeon]
MSENVIEIKNLSFTYPAGVEALKDINLEIKKGEIVAIIGQNGSGKTTLVKHFNGLLQPTSGTVIINGKDAKQSTTAQLSREVGYVFQDPDDQLFMSKVKDEIAFGPKNLKMKKNEVNKRVRDTLKLVKLWKFRNTHPLDLNLDDKKLIAIASIIAMNPHVIILDEPTSGQDHRGILRAESLIKKLSKEHTIIIISHDMDLVSKIAQRVIVMYNSKILMTGTPKEVFIKTSLLAKTHLKPPLITQLSQKTKGMRSDILSIDEFIEELKTKKPHSSKSR